MKRNRNPVLRADYPDPDVLRVEDTYYMLSSTLHFLPGAQILRSYDLVNWEIAGYVFESFGETEEVRMNNERTRYGCGMRAGSLRYHKGRFYVCFSVWETGKTYFYQAESVEGPWESRCIDSYLHRCSLFFDEDDRIYLVSGRGELWIRELLPDLSGPARGGLERRILTEGQGAGHGSESTGIESEGVGLGLEGAHIYKICGKYYLFAVNRSGESGGRVWHCFCSDDLDGTFRGGPVCLPLEDSLFVEDNGVTWGSLVEANDGSWFAVAMQDGGAAGRMPALAPLRWEGERPVYGRDGRIPRYVSTMNNRPCYRYEPLYTSDDFSYREREEGGWKLKPQWQWNHEPDPALWEIQRSGGLCITTGKLCTNVTQAVNTLTQRMFAPGSSVEVTVDASDLNEGDYAGICALQGCYGMIAVTRELRRYYLVLIEREDTEKNRNTASADYMPGIVTEKINLTAPAVRLRMEADFRDGADRVSFSYREPREGGKWRKAGGEHRLSFGRDHLAGCRCGLSIFATKSVGGSALFMDFHYECML